MRHIQNFENHRGKNTFEYLVESLILESKLVLSDKLKGVIVSLPDSKIKKSILDLLKTGQDLTIQQNFFDVTDNKDTINFIQDRKGQEILGGASIKYQVLEPHRRLTLNKEVDGSYKNQLIFDELGFDPETMNYERPGQGFIGEILSETSSKDTPGKIYVLFKFHNSGQVYYSIYDKQALQPKDDRLDQVWKLTANPIAVGRGFRSILTAAKIAFTDRELEKFVNDYKSHFDILNDAFTKFDIVNGWEIAKWYKHSNYESQKSTLGNSCMKEVNDEFFDIYCLNPSVCSLVILYSDKGGTLVDGKYKNNKIKGRALLWETNIGPFMDRIYTNNDADVSLFISFADKNNWWHKAKQDSKHDFTAVRGSESTTPEIKVDLDKSEFDYYPYVDTLCFLHMEEYYLTNYINTFRIQPGLCELRSTEGDYDPIS